MKQAKFIVQQLHEKGFTAYFAGGWVRDYLLNHPSDDIDIATNASPEVVQSLFSHTVPIGAKFGIILVIIEKKQYEVATFREDIEYTDGRRPAKIKFSTEEEDAKRRDFTINGMFYDPINDKIIDFVKGKEDLEKKVIKAIGNPHERIKEDRLRMIRAIRLSARFSFEIDEETEKAIMHHANELFPSVAIERVWQEITKMAKYRGFRKALLMLHYYGLMEVIFPKLKGTSIEEMNTRTTLIDDFPSRAPVIVSILELFKKSTLEEQIDLCKYLKLSNREIDFIVFLYKAKELVNSPRNIEDDKWVHFYANPYSNLALQILAIHSPAEKRKDFLIEHQTRKEDLSFYVQKKKNNDPIIKSDHLKVCGIPPGPNMGALLDEAQKIAINSKLTTVDAIIEKLKRSKLWPQEII